MSKFSSEISGDEFLPDEITSYKPVSPSATLGLLVSIAAAISAITVVDLGWFFAAVPAVGLLLGFRALGSIKRYDMAGSGAAKAAIVISSLALVGGAGAYVYYLKTAIPPGYQEISYEPLQVEPQYPDSKAKELDGKKIYLRGYIYPTDDMNRTKDGVSSFVLCRDNGTCCFGGQPKLVDMVEVKLKDPLKLHYTSSLHGVGGTFKVRTEKGPGSLGTIVYHIDDADILH
jgi:hypothetical protein